MKIVLSRKGFDSAAGRIPNAILPDGRLVMFPIPDRRSPIRYDAIRADVAGYGSLYEVIRDLGGSVKPGHGAHLDPDLLESSLPSRPPGWRPVLGQVGAELGHLTRLGVGVGDLFLFFGRYRETSLEDGRLRYRPGARDRHVVFGWLQVGEIVDFGGALPSWLPYHPHAHRGPGANRGFVAAAALRLDGRATGLPGAGVLRFRPELVLTRPGQHRVGVWDLPAWFWPPNDEPSLSRHDDASRWRRLDGERVELRAVSRGQEFVLDGSRYPASVAWLRTLLVER